MTDNALKIAIALPLPPAALAELAESEFGPFTVVPLDPGDAEASQVTLTDCDAMLMSVDEAGAMPALACDAARELAVVLVSTDVSAGFVVAALRLGAQDVLHPDDLALDLLARRVRAAIERKRLEREARTAYATDLATGLPHQQQLIEHMSHLLALREREPAPMAVLALRIEGLATTEARLGAEAASALRRRLAVRLRAGVRASDVVASIADDTFAVLLGSLLVPDDAQRVGAKLLEALLKPVRVAGTEVAVAAALGVGQYPQDGTQPDALLRRAVGLAASAQAHGRAGLANFVETGGRMPHAANDDLTS